MSSLIAAALAEHLGEPIRIIGSFVMLRLAYNRGIAFSISIPGGMQTLLILGALAAVLIMAFRDRTQARGHALAFGLIVGGATANLIDRFLDGVVTDYFAIGTFPIFNIADACICIGAGLLAMIRRG